MDAALIFFLALSRVTSLVLTAPIFGSRAVPLKIRFGIAVLLSLAAFPLITPPNFEPTNLEDLFSAVFSEVVIGSLLGLGVMIMFSAAQFAGTVIGQMAGIQISNTLDPQTGENTSTISQMFAILSLAAFALAGGPELVVSALLDTFIYLPLGTELVTSRVSDTLVTLLQQSFILTLRGVAPAVAAMLIATVVIGFISRTYPQMNLLGMGLSSNLIVMFLAVFLTLGGSVWLFVDDLDHFVSMITDAMQSSIKEVAKNE
tara:strand:+ start:803 stop:1579 length:777 start_codon:yes stop_codon:yes gene_type:complete